MPVGGGDDDAEGAAVGEFLFGLFSPDTTTTGWLRALERVDRMNVKLLVLQRWPEAVERLPPSRGAAAAAPFAILLGRTSPMTNLWDWIRRCRHLPSENVRAALTALATAVVQQCRLNPNEQYATAFARDITVVGLQSLTGLLPADCLDFLRGWEPLGRRIGTLTDADTRAALLDVLQHAPATRQADPTPARAEAERLRELAVAQMFPMLSTLYRFMLRVFVHYCCGHEEHMDDGSGTLTEAVLKDRLERAKEELRSILADFNTMVTPSGLTPNENTLFAMNKEVTEGLKTLDAHLDHAIDPTNPKPSAPTPVAMRGAITAATNLKKSKVNAIRAAPTAENLALYCAAQLIIPALDAVQNALETAQGMNFADLGSKWSLCKRVTTASPRLHTVLRMWSSYEATKQQIAIHLGNNTDRQYTFNASTNMALAYFRYDDGNRRVGRLLLGQPTTYFTMSPANEVECLELLEEAVGAMHGVVWQTAHQQQIVRRALRRVARLANQTLGCWHALLRGPTDENALTSEVEPESVARTIQAYERDACNFDAVVETQHHLALTRPVLLHCILACRVGRAVLDVHLLAQQRVVVETTPQHTWFWRTLVRLAALGGGAAVPRREHPPELARELARLDPTLHHLLYSGEASGAEDLARYEYILFLSETVLRRMYTEHEVHLQGLTAHAHTAARILGTCDALPTLRRRLYRWYRSVWTAHAGAPAVRRRAFGTVEGPTLTPSSQAPVVPTALRPRGEPGLAPACPSIEEVYQCVGQRVRRNETRCDGRRPWDPHREADLGPDGVVVTENTLPEIVYAGLHGGEDVRLPQAGQPGCDAAALDAIRLWFRLTHPDYHATRPVQEHTLSVLLDAIESWRRVTASASATPQQPAAPAAGAPGPLSWTQWVRSLFARWRWWSRPAAAAAAAPTAAPPPPAGAGAPPPPEDPLATVSTTARTFAQSLGPLFPTDPPCVVRDMGEALMHLLMVRFLGSVQHLEAVSDPQATEPPADGATSSAPAGAAAAAAAGGGGGGGNAPVVSPLLLRFIAEEERGLQRLLRATLQGRLADTLGGGDEDEDEDGDDDDDTPADPELRREQRRVAEHILVSVERACCIGITSLAVGGGVDPPGHPHQLLVQTHLHARLRADGRHGFSTYSLLRLLVWHVRDLLAFVRLRDPCSAAFVASTAWLTPQDILAHHGTGGAVWQLPTTAAEEQAVFRALLDRLRRCQRDLDVVRLVGRWLQDQGYGEREFASEGCHGRATRLAPLADHAHVVEGRVPVLGAGGSWS